MSAESSRVAANIVRCVFSGVLYSRLPASKKYFSIEGFWAPLFASMYSFTGYLKDTLEYSESLCWVKYDAV